MKHIHTLLMTAVLSTSASAVAADASPPAEPEARRTILGISVMPLFLGNRVLELEGERVVSPRLSVGLGLRTGILHSKSESDFVSGLGGIAEDSEQSSYLLRAEPMARVFLTGTAPEGMWLSPRLGVARQWGKSRFGEEASSSTSNTRAWSVSGAALLGYSTIVGRGLAIQFGAGLEAEYRRQTLKVDMPVLGAEGEFVELESGSRGLSLHERLELSVGWAF